MTSWTSWRLKRGMAMLQIDDPKPLYGATARLFLRRLRPADLVAYCRCYQCAETMDYIGRPLSVAAASASFAEAVKRQDEPWAGPGARLRIAISSNEHTELEGLLAVDGCSSPYTAEVGVLLQHSLRGRGMAHEALGALIQRLEQMGVLRTQLRADPRNEAMLRLASRLDFTAQRRESVDMATVIYRRHGDLVQHNQSGGRHLP